MTQLQSLRITNMGIGSIHCVLRSAHQQASVAHLIVVHTVSSAHRKLVFVFFERRHVVHLHKAQTEKE